MCKHVSRLAAVGSTAQVVRRPTYRRPLNRTIALTLLISWLAGCGGYEPSRPPPPAEAATPKPDPAKPAVSTIVAKKAEVGVGKKGRGYGKGVVATPVRSLFAFRQRAVFDIQIPQAMKLFKGMHGRAPKDHDEFMEKIIKANHIKLPELPEGQRYWYDAETEELMVLQPA